MRCDALIYSYCCRKKERKRSVSVSDSISISISVRCDCVVGIVSLFVSSLPCFVCYVTRRFFALYYNVDMLMYIKYIYRIVISIYSSFSS